MHFFIDTNAYLSFYHFSGEDLEELKKLGVMLKGKHLTLLVPEQTRDEFARRRATKIADALSRLEKQKLTMNYPQLCRTYDEYEQLRSLQRSYDATHAKLIAVLKEDIRNEHLKADVVINALFGLAKPVATSDALLERVRRRTDVGNPPGKKGSLGDAINWEAVLEAVPDGEDVCIVSDDKDYSSELNEDEFHPFLLAEWKRRRKAGLFYYRRLSDFFSERFPKIKLATALEKELLIQELAASESFIVTHRVVGRLLKFAEFSTDEAKAIFAAAELNSQVHQIASDSDVDALLEAALDGHEAAIDPARYWLLVDGGPPKPPL